MSWTFYFTAALCIWPYLAAVIRTDELYDLRMSATATAAQSLMVSLMFAPLVYLLLVLHVIAYACVAACGDHEEFWAVLNRANRI